MRVQCLDALLDLTDGLQLVVVRLGEGDRRFAPRVAGEEAGLGVDLPRGGLASVGINEEPVDVLRVRKGP